MFMITYNAFLKEDIFPEQWKRQRLVLLPKGAGPPYESSYIRSILLLNTKGKILQRLMHSRLLLIIEEKKGLSEHQYGFRKLLSTVDAINWIMKLAENAIKGKRWKCDTIQCYCIITLDAKMYSI